MRETGGSCQVAGTLGYVSQQAWIFSGTVRDNIILGSHYEADWFSQVVEVCALTRDFQLLEAGDLTEVGERGITLSGGQKQRISLARALYSRYCTLSLCSVLCTLYSVFCTLCSVLCTLHSLLQGRHLPPGRSSLRGGRQGWPVHLQEVHTGGHEGQDRPAGQSRPPVPEGV